MPDWPQANYDTLNHQAIHSYGAGSLARDPTWMHWAFTGAASFVWPAANRALYIPFIVEATVTAYQISVENGATVSGNLDVGLYSRFGARLASSGSTTQAGTSTIQPIDITDTVLAPGVYYMALCVDNTTATFIRSSTSLIALRMCGVQQQAVGAVTLPDPATFANPTSPYLPAISVQLAATV